MKALGANSDLGAMHYINNEFARQEYGFRRGCRRSWERISDTIALLTVQDCKSFSPECVIRTPGLGNEITGAQPNRLSSISFDYLVSYYEKIR